MLAFILMEAYAAYADIASNKFISDLTAFLGGESLLLPADGSYFVMERGVARVVAIVLFVLLASLGGSIGLGLVRAGAHVLSPQFNEQIAQLKQRIDDVANRLKHRTPTI
ncbi:MAG: hypothetical protein LBR88_07630 [Zoogloeaceae bacterium]|nr:hypothetical protein [Zoogloeaceae bacterium]